MTAPEMRREALLRMRQAYRPEEQSEERITPLRLLGLVLFALGMWLVLAYGVVIIGLAVTAP